MKLNFAHICDYASLSENGKVNIMGIFQSFFTKSVPFTYPQFFIVTNSTVNRSGNLKQSIRFIRDKDGQDIISPLEFNVSATQPSASGESKVGVLARLNNVQFDEVGSYTVQIFIEEEKVGEAKFFVEEK